MQAKLMHAAATILWPCPIPIRIRAELDVANARWFAKTTGFCNFALEI